MIEEVKEEVKLGYVYKIISPSNRIYVGSTINIKSRWAKYKRLECESQIKLYRSFLKYGVENHTFEIIWEGNIVEMKEKETFLGTNLNVIIEGLNCILPKLGEKYSTMCIETRNKFKLNFKGKKHTKEAKLKISQKNKNNKHNLGNKHSLETKDKISKIHKGRIFSEEHKNKIKIKTLNNINVSINNLKNTSIKKQKIILQYTLDNQFIKEWSSIIKAAKELNIHASSISNVCLNKVKTAGKFKWRYKDEK